jgi:alpha-beta hydrolase superfamily lysophospholipase
MGNKSFVMQQALEFIDRGYNVLLPDTRGHGKSGGNRTSFGYHESEEVKLAVDHIRSQGEKNIFLWGISMGAVEIMKAVAENDMKISGLILEMPFGSLQSHVKSRLHNMKFPKQPLGFLITFWIGVERGFNGIAYKTDEYAKKIKCPVLLQYGTNDQLVSREETDNIYNAFSSTNKKLILYYGARHESLLNYDSPRWRYEIDEFFKSIVL